MHESCELNEWSFSLCLPFVASRATILFDVLSKKIDFDESFHSKSEFYYPSEDSKLKWIDFPNFSKQFLLPLETRVGHTVFPNMDLPTSG